MIPDADALDRVAALDCVLDPLPWPFAIDQAAAIDRLWDAARHAKPQLFNGRVLMLTRGGIERDGGRTVFRGAFAPVDFKAFLAWRDLGNPVRDRRNGFGMAALRAADGAFVLGEMAPHTATAGLVYFPAGTPDLNDVVGDRVDIAGSIVRELAEETGLDPGTLAFGEGFTVVQDVHRVAVLQEVRSPDPAARLVERIGAALARQAEPEFLRLHIVRRAADITPAMPPFVARYLRYALTDGQPG